MLNLGAMKINYLKRCVPPVVGLVVGLAIYPVVFGPDNNKMLLISPTLQRRVSEQSLFSQDNKRMLLNSLTLQRRVSEQSLILNTSAKAVVYRHNGKTLERLNDFCTWTLPMMSAALSIPNHGNMTICIHDPQNDPVLSKGVNETGRRDPKNVKIVMDELHKYPEAGFLDLGSHIGVYGLSIAKVMGRKVVTVDPMIENTKRVCKTIELHQLTDNVTVVFNALSDVIARVNFRQPAKHIGGTRVFKQDDGKVKTKNGETIDHYSITLDEMLPIVPFKSAVMKIDVEKSEYLAMLGGLKFLREINVHSILMEWFNIVHTDDASPLVKLMRELKYVPYIPSSKGSRTLVRYEDYKQWTVHHPNLDILWVKER